MPNLFPHILPYLSLTSLELSPGNHMVTFVSAVANMLYRGLQATMTLFVPLLDSLVMGLRYPRSSDSSNVSHTKISGCSPAPPKTYRPSWLKHESPWPRGLPETDTGAARPVEPDRPIRKDFTLPSKASRRKCP